MRQLIIKWSRAFFGWPPAPATFLEKKTLIIRVAQERKLDLFVETGTFRGEMIDAQMSHFRRLMSIELSEELYQAAIKKFAGCPQVQLHQGDSGLKLKEIAAGFQEPALFWLDAHYSGDGTAGGNDDAPILKELSGIAARQQPKDVILIDDARLFGLKRAYPKQNVLREFVARHWPKHSFSILSDVICIMPIR